MSSAVGAARRVVVKVGSAVLSSADGAGHSRPVMAAIARQIAAARAEGRELVLVSSGAILAGAQELGEPLPVKHVALKQALAAVGQVQLMRRWTDIFSWHEVRVAQVLLTRDDVGHRHRFINARQTLSQLLERGILPIINENDTVVVEEIKLGDNDQLSALVTNLVTADLLVLLTEVDGLYTADPHRHPDARLLPLVEKITPEVQRLAGHGGPAGRGGMISKLEAARQASLFGVPTVIANGRDPTVLDRILRGEATGTLFLPAAERLDSRKHWIAFSHPPTGRLLLDEGAVRAVRRGGKSLLPSGIVAVEGSFEVGDLVLLVSASDGRGLGRGVTYYSSQEVARIQGLQSSEIEAAIGYKSADEVIHRDHLVIDAE
jgi:glutamate 5-kinase